MIQNVGNYRNLAQMQELSLSSRKPNDPLKTQQLLDSHKTSITNENQDSITISQEAKDEYNKMVARAEIGTELRSAEDFIIKIYPGSSLSGKSLNGEYDNIFNENTANQYKVFTEFLKETGAYDGMSKDKTSKDKIDEFNDMLKSITFGLDTINGRDGHKDLDTESAFMITSSTRALQYFNENFVPETARDGFNDLINEYEHFNVNGRKNLVETMTLEPIKITEKIYTTYTKNGKSHTHVIYDPEQGTQEYRTREEIIARTKSKYQKESGNFEKEFDILKNNLNSTTLAKVLKNTGNAFEEYDTRGQNYRADAAKKKVNNSMSDARNYWNQLMHYKK